MKIKSIPISEIVVGDRRREDFGDIQGLADSIAKFQLFHPIIVDDRNNLIAGERRLRACNLLGWSEIPARAYRDLSEDERHEIELEENIRRKDLTTVEVSKQYVKQANIVAPLISTATVEKDVRGRKSNYQVPKKDVASALGISTSTLVNAEQHVAAIEKYPELAVIIPTQKDTITVAKNLDALPEKQRSEARSRLMSHDQNTLALLAEKPPMPASKPRPKSAGGKWRDGLSQIRVFISSIKNLGGGEQLTAAWTDQERHAFLAELYAFREDVDAIISELEEVEGELKQRVG